MSVLLLIVGLVLLLIGGELIVSSSVTLAGYWRISPLLIGITIVGFGSSLPEFIVMLQGVAENKFDIVVGSVVGSNIANILLVLGLATVIYPMQCQRAMVMRDGVAMLVSTLLLTVLALIGRITALDGAVMLALLLGYLTYSYFSEKRLHGETAQHVAEKNAAAVVSPKAIVWNLAKVAASLAALVIGADLLIDGASDLARAMGISEAVIGLSLVAVGTSLPEVVTACVAAYRKHSEVALGNVLGSNIFNSLGMLGAGSLFKTITIHDQIVRFDIWVMFIVSTIAIWFIKSDYKLTRTEGISLLLLYAMYVFTLIYGVPGVVKP